MKKLVAIVLALVMMLALYVPTFAAGGSTPSASSGNSTVDVDGEFVPASAPDTVISVDIEWDPLVFTYTAASAGVWNATTHTYDGAHPASWSDNKAGIKVTNHSNSWVEAKFAFTAGKEGLKGVFYEQNADNSFTVLTKDYLVELTTAVGTTAETAPDGKIFFGMDSTSVGITESEAQSSIGTITISIAKIPPKMTVGTEAELKAAIAALKTTGGTITLTSDLTLTDPIEISAGTGTSTAPLIIDFGGKTIKGRVAIVGTETSRSYVTLKNGALKYDISADDGTALRDDPTQAAVYARYTDLKLEDLAVESAQLILRTSDGTKTLITASESQLLQGWFTARNIISGSYLCVAIYNTSSDEFILANTGKDTDIKFAGYIVSDHTITLKENTTNGEYSFINPFNGETVYINTDDGDKNISSQDTFELMGASQTKYGSVIFGTDVVLTE